MQIAQFTLNSLQLQQEGEKAPLQSPGPAGTRLPVTAALRLRTLFDMI